MTMNPMTRAPKAHRTAEPDPVKVRGLSHSYQKKVILSGVSFTVKAGESLAIMGPSGSGKTTLLSCLLGLIKPKSGTVEMQGVELPGLRRSERATFRAHHMGMVFQHSELLDDLTAEENVALPAMLAKQRGDNPLLRARELLSEFEVPAQTQARDLSGGEQQRTAVARALINSPEIILADEPTGSLDMDLRDKIAQLLFEIPSQRNTALIVVTHDPKVAERADRIATLSETNLVITRRAFGH